MFMQTKDTTIPASMISAFFRACEKRVKVKDIENLIFSGKLI
jgi:hypothetical protein